MSKNFIHLRCHTSFSLAEGAIKIDDLINLAKRKRMPALAVTDTGNLFCSLEFSLACVKGGIQPIIGCILLVDMEDSSELSSIVLLAKDEQGFKNLLKLGSKPFLTKYENQVGHIKLTDLENYSDGLICLSGGHAGPVGQAILQNNKTLAKQYFLRLKEIFADRFYAEIMRHGLENQEKTEAYLLELAYEHDVPLVATNDVMFADPHMHEAHHALTCIASGAYVSEEDSNKFTPHHYFKTSA